MSAPTRRLELGRLTQRAEFLYVRTGAYRAIGCVVIQARKTPSTEKNSTHMNEANCHMRVGFTATKKIGNAVVRNRAKRRMREAARQLLPQHGLCEYDYVFIARHSIVDSSFQSLLEDSEKALQKLKRQLQSRSRGPKSQARGTLSQTHG